MAFRDILIVILVDIMWGLNFIAVLFAVEDFPPMLANCVRFIIVLLFLAPFLKPVKGRMKDMLIIAFVMGFAHFGAIFIGMSKAEGVSALAITAQLSVPFATLFSAMFLKEKVGWKRVAAIALSFSGVVVLGFDPAVFGYLDAVLWIVFATIIYGISAVLMRNLKDVSPATTQGWIAIGGIVGSLLLSLAWETGQWSVITSASTLAWGGVVYTALCSSIIGHGGVNYLLTKYEVAMVAPYLLLTPLFAILGGIIFLDETLTWRVIVGGALTIGGVFIVTLRNKARAADAQPAQGEAAA